PLKYVVHACLLCQIPLNSVPRILPAAILISAFPCEAEFQSSGIPTRIQRLMQVSFGCNNWCKLIIPMRSATMQADIPDDRRAYAEFMERVRALYPELTPQFQAGAKYLLDHPDEIAVSSMRSVARSAQVQSSTLVRLAQRLGFAGWPEMKAIFVERVRSV